MPIRVLVADDQALVRAGFAKLIDATDGLEVVGQAADGAQAVDLAQRLLPDVVLMDIRMPVLDGIDATRRICSAHDERVRVLVLTTFGTDEYVEAALRSGASGFLLKDAPPEQLVAALAVVAHGDALLDPAVTRAVIRAAVRGEAPSRQAKRRLAGLTTREREILELVGHGLSNAEIADRLVVSEATVKTHIGHLFTKLRLRDRVQAVILAYDTGLVNAVKDE
jgi:DNA-binding NarL/FixJ family response regulator